VTVQVLACSVVTHRGPRIGVAGSDLDVSQIHASIETGREQCSDHAEYLSRSGVPGGYSRVDNYGYESARPCSSPGQERLSAATAMRAGHVRVTVARRRAAWVTGELAAGGTSVPVARDASGATGAADCQVRRVT